MVIQKNIIEFQTSARESTKRIELGPQQSKFDRCMMEPIQDILQAEV
jgi:hypothetical protein